MHIDEPEHKCIRLSEYFTRGDVYHLIPTEIIKDGITYNWFKHE